MSSKAQRRVCVGLEGTAGQAAPVDVALHAVGELRPVVGKVQVNEDVGTFAQPRHYIGEYHGEGSIKAEACFEEGPILASMGLGSVSPVGGSAPYTWTFPLPDATAPTIAPWTVEMTDGEDWTVRTSYGFFKSLTISGEPGKAWQISGDLVGADTDYPVDLSANPVLAVVTAIRQGKTALYLDNLYANIGDTKLTGAFISFDWKLDKLLHQKQLSDGYLYPTSHGSDRYDVTLDLLLECDNATVRALRDHVLTTDLMAVRIECIETAATTEARIDGMYMVKDVATLSDRDGNNVVAVSLALEKDTLGNTGEVEFICSLAAL